MSASRTHIPVTGLATSVFFGTRVGRNKPESSPLSSYRSLSKLSLNSHTLLACTASCIKQLHFVIMPLCKETSSFACFEMCNRQLHFMPPDSSVEENEKDICICLLHDTVCSIDLIHASIFFPSWLLFFFFPSCFRGGEKWLLVPLSQSRWTSLFVFHYQNQYGILSALKFRPWIFALREKVATGGRIFFLQLISCFVQSPESSLLLKHL